MTVLRLPAVVPALALTSLLLAGCMVGPTYHAPVETPVSLAAAPRVTAEPSHADWWRAFGDPQLDQLIRRGLAANLDVRVALDRVKAARALFRENELDLAPHVGASTAYQASRQQAPGFTTERLSVRQASLGLDAAWEIDLFGRVRHEVDAARADADAAEADLRGAQVLVAAEIARNYIALRGAQARRVVAESDLRTAQDTLRLTALRREIGDGDPVDLESAKARLSATEASIPPLRMREAEAAHRLAVLLGVRPGELDAELAESTPATAQAPVAVPIGDATDFLRRRPDVLAAERRLAAETARTGAASAELFPRVTVTGFVGFLSGDVSSLFKSGSRAWSVSPQVTWPAFDIGSAAARLSTQRAHQDASHAAYRQTALRAIEDLQNALVDYRERQQQVVSLADQVAASRRAAELAHVRYEEGSIDFLRVLDAERTRLAAEDALTAAQTDANLDVVAIYKALGG
jgi:multidrug efflux system outer membrane protein